MRARIAVDHAPALNPQQFTFSAWVRPEAVDVNLGVVTKEGTGGSGANGYFFNQRSNNKILFGVGVVAGTVASIEPSTGITPGTYQHLVGTYDGTNLRYYINGVLEGQAVAQTNLSSPRPLQIGRKDNPGLPTGGYEYFSGDIDDVRLYQRALPSDQVTALYFAELPPPAISSQPTNVVAIVGTNVSFGIQATGMSPLTYQWLKNGAVITAATNSVYALTNVQPADAASYSAIVSAGTNSVASSNALLTVLIPPSITTAPLPQTVRVGTTVSFAVAISGTGPFSYQWMLNGSNIVGATSSIFSLTNAQLSHGGGYSVRVSGPGGTVTSSPVSLDITLIDMFSGVTVSGSVGATYRIEYADVVGAQTNWVGLTNITLSTSRQVVIDFGSPGRQKRFYRIIRQP